MKYKVLIPVIIIGALAAFFSFKYLDTFGSKSTNQQEVIMKTVMGIIENGHFSPRDLNDSTSARIFDNTFENLDYEKKFFLQSDIEKLSKYRYQLDEQLQNNDITFFNELNKVFNERLAETQKYYREVLQGDMSFNANDEIETNTEKLKYAKNSADLKKKWALLMKQRVLTKYYELKKEQEQKLKDSANYVAAPDAELYKKSKETILKVQDRFFKRLNKLSENDRFAIYINSITEAQDPHTTFMQPTDKKKFDEMMSGSFIGIGATLQQMDDGRVKITSILTGSPSWKQGNLKADDIIEKVAQGEATPVEVDGYDIDDVIKMIRGKEGTTVKLTVAKPDGSRIVVPIVRGKVELENVYAKSAIIEEDGAKIGYIKLPEFYADFNGISGRRSATDVEKEVTKLMAENVDGIILDVQNNGGGSLSDVVDIVGLFIGSGPVVQIKGSGNQSTTLRSKRKEPLYTGPLAIMINSGSASASEILAAAIQDYKRGVIIGSRSFGKGTVQKLVPLDQFVSSADRNMIIAQLNESKGGGADFDGIGSLKLTIQKFYRVDGGSTQLKGVTPDILLPDAFELLDEIGEKKNKNSLPWDKIQPADYQPFYTSNGFAELNKLSLARTSDNESFKLIQQTAKRLKERIDNSILPLNEKSFFQKMAEGEDLTKKLEQLDSLKTGLVVKNLSVDLPNVNVDETTKENNSKWLKDLGKDPFINEAANILNDIISNKVRLTLAK